MIREQAKGMYACVYIYYSSHLRMKTGTPELDMYLIKPNDKTLLRFSLQRHYLCGTIILLFLNIIVSNV